MSPPTDAKDHHAALVRVEGRVAVLEDKVSGMSDKLTAIASTSAMTADYLRDMRDDHRADRAADIEDRKDRREWYQRGTAAVWGLVRQPLGLLLAAMGAYFAFSYFGVPQAHEPAVSHPAPVQVGADPESPAESPTEAPATEVMNGE